MKKMIVLTSLWSFFVFFYIYIIGLSEGDEEI